MHGRYHRSAQINAAPAALPCFCETPRFHHPSVTNGVVEGKVSHKARDFHHAQSVNSMAETKVPHKA
jgi:hypothetical protein